MDPTFRPGQTDLQGRAQRMFGPLIFLMIFSLCLQVAGFAAPGWVIIELGPVEMHVGLWIIRYCFNDKCETKSIDEVETFSVLSSGLTEYRVETSLALAFLLIALVVGIFIRRQGKIQLVSFMVMILTFVSGILAMIAACKIGDDTRKTQELLGTLSPFKVPYALLLTGTGGIFTIIVGFVVIFGVRPWSSESAPAHGYPMTSQPGYAAQPYNQPYQPQAYPSQPYAAQPQPSQPYGAQSYPAQKYPYGNSY